MTEPGAQQFANHTRWLPMYHFFAFPVTLAYAIYQITVAVRNPTKDSILFAMFTLAVATAVLASRLMANTVQDRVIRLEETLRLQRVLPASMQGDIARISRQQFVALRFAPDEELPELVQQAVSGQVTTPKAIKQAIKTWRADHLRA